MRPLLTVLNYSGGKQSSALLWMVLRGDLPRPESFLVLNANPGMENSGTYQYTDMMRVECARAGIEFITAPGPDLFYDLISVGTATRVDNPPYWTKSAKGKQGRLKQKCTAFYKVAPMDRVIRRVLEERFGISQKSKRLPEGCVEKWIGFTLDEVSRMKPSSQKYVQFTYPLIDLGMGNEATLRYLTDNDLPVPPRSVCNACFANGLQTFKEMHDNRPADWAQAVLVDEAVRDLSGVGVGDPVFVSKTMIPLRELAERGFDLSDETEDADGFSCDSGHCFV